MTLFSILVSLLALAPLAAGWTTADTPVIKKGTYVLDAAHSEIGFEVRHLGLSNVKGSFSGVTGEIVFAEDALSSLSASAAIDVGTISTKNDDRDNHLKSADFFDVENHPTMTFNSSGIDTNDDGSFTLNGTLTIRGISQDVALAGEFLGMATDPWGNEKIAFTAETKINRKDFGLTWNQILETGGLLVAEEVKLVLDIQAAAKNG